MEIEMNLLYGIGLVGLIGMGAGALYYGQMELANTISAGIIGFIGGGVLAKTSA